MKPAGFLVVFAIVGAFAANGFASDLRLPPASPTVVQALQTFTEERAKISVGGSISIEKAKPIHEAFFQAVDIDKLSVTDAAAVVQTPVFGFDRERAMQLRERLQALAETTAGAESVLAAAAGLRLPARKGADREKIDALYRRVIAAPDLAQFLQTEHAGLVLNAVGEAPKSVAQEQRAPILQIVQQLDPVASRHAMPVAEKYWKAASRLIDDPTERESLRLQLVAFLTAGLENRGNDQMAETRLQQGGERALRILKSPFTSGQVIGHDAPPLNFLWASRPGLKTLVDLRGKIVVLDFWATWCGPCIESFPKTRELASFYRDYPVEVVGVTSLQGVVIMPGQKAINCKGAPEKEFSLLPEVQKVHDMQWTIAVSQEPVFNPDYGVDGIPSMAIIAPDGTVRHVRLSPHEPLAGHRKLIDALLNEFELKVPPS